MSTITLTQPRLDFDQQFDRLIDILECFSEEQDPLSKRIHVWGVEVLSGAEQNADLAQFVANKIDILRDQILKCPITARLLSDPVIERGWVWERSIHLESNFLFGGASPLDSLNMESGPSPHLYAREIIGWINLVKPLASPIEMAITPLAQGSIPSEVKRFLYSRSARVANALRQEEIFRESISQALVEQQATLVEIGQLDQVALAEAHLRAQTHQEELASRLDAMQRVHSEAIAQINQTIAAREAAYRNRVETFERNLVAMRQTNTETASRLQVELDSLRQQHELQTANLSGQIHQYRQDHQQLQLRVSQATQNVNQVQNLLNQQTAENDRHAILIKELQKKNLQQQNEISHLANKARKRPKFLGIF